MGSGGAFEPRSHPSTNPCTLNKGDCYSIQGQSPSADQCVPPLMPITWVMNRELNEIELN